MLSGISHDLRTPLIKNKFDDCPNVRGTSQNNGCLKIYGKIEELQSLILLKMKKTNLQ